MKSKIKFISFIFLCILLAEILYLILPVKFPEFNLGDFNENRILVMYQEIGGGICKTIVLSDTIVLYNKLYHKYPNISTDEIIVKGKEPDEVFHFTEGLFCDRKFVLYGKIIDVDTKVQYCSPEKIKNEIVPVFKSEKWNHFDYIMKYNYPVTDFDFFIKDIMPITVITTLILYLIRLIFVKFKDGDKRIS